MFQVLLQGLRSTGREVYRAPTAIHWAPSHLPSVPAGFVQASLRSSVIPVPSWRELKGITQKGGEKGSIEGMSHSTPRWQRRGRGGQGERPAEYGPDGPGQHRATVSPGTHVEVVQKQHQRTGQLTTGVVSRLLTKSGYHPRGIKVMLKGGQVGRVQNILDYGESTSSSRMFGSSTRASASASATATTTASTLEEDGGRGRDSSDVDRVGESDSGTASGVAAVGGDLRVPKHSGVPVETSGFSSRKSRRRRLPAEGGLSSSPGLLSDRSRNFRSTAGQVYSWSLEDGKLVCRAEDGRELDQEGDNAILGMNSERRENDRGRGRSNGGRRRGRGRR